MGQEGVGALNPDPSQPGEAAPSADCLTITGPSQKVAASCL